MKSVNEQLGLPLINDGRTTYQPAQYNGTGIDYERSYATPVVTGGVYKNASGSWANNTKKDWSGCNSCGTFSGVDGGWSSAVGSMEGCYGKCKLLYFNKDKETACINECKAKYGVNSIADFMASGMKPSDAQNIKNALPTSLGGNKVVDTSSAKSKDQTNTGADSATSGGLSTGAKIGLGIGVLAVVGLVIFLVKRNKK
jgi:hypothetical protein